MTSSIPNYVAVLKNCHLQNLLRKRSAIHCYLQALSRKIRFRINDITAIGVNLGL